MARSCYFAAECADKLGMSLDTFYRQREALHAKGMPHPATAGRLRIPREPFDAWLHGRALPPPAPRAYKTDEEHLLAFQREYSR